MSIRKHIDEQGDKMKLVGGIISVLNRIESYVKLIVSTAFIDNKYISYEKIYLINDILNDDKIFCKFEEKRLLLEKVIYITARIVNKKNIDIKFDHKKYLDFCEKIKNVQKIRNNIAHNNLGFSAEGFAVIYKRKSDKLLLEEKDEKNMYKKVLLNLEKELEEAIVICEEAGTVTQELTPILTSVFSHDTEPM